MADLILRAISKNGAVRAFAADTAVLCERARLIHGTYPVVTAALGRTLTGAAMLGMTLKNQNESLSIQIKGDGPIGGIVAVSDHKSRVRGYVHNNHVELPLNAKGKLDVGRAIGKGYLTVIRDYGLKEPYVGRVELQTGEIAEDLTYYLLHSEQVPSAVALGVLVDVDYSVKSAGGIIVQLMPEASETEAKAVEDNINALQPVSSMLASGMSCKDMLDAVLKGFEYEITEKAAPSYECNCSRKRLYKVLVSLGRAELEDIIINQGEAELTCHFCGKAYHFGKEELACMMKP